MSESRLLVLGDVHGAARALRQVFERAAFDYEHDRLIFVGDVADGWPETRQCIDELLKVRHLVYILGNHDDWFRQWVRVGSRPHIWTSQGGLATMYSYGDSPDDVPPEHRAFLESAKAFYEEGGRMFVHAGWENRRGTPLGATDQELMWDRSMWRGASMRAEHERYVEKYDEVFIGHTTTERTSLEPVRHSNVWNVDQGCGWGGKLTLMDVETKEFWQSDIAAELYPEHGGRRSA
jgi:serine/threonine protein phosphatase 1